MYVFDINECIVKFDNSNIYDNTNITTFYEGIMLNEYVAYV